MKPIIKRVRQTGAWTLLVVLLCGYLPQINVSGAQTGTIFHQVRFFDHNGNCYDEISGYVEDGERANEPAVPAIPDGMNSFLGWFENGTEPDPENAYRFTHRVYQDTDLYAAFSGKNLVRFLDAYGNVTYSVLADPDGNTVIEEPALAILSPDGVFTGTWLVEGSNEVFDFSQPVDQNITLIPKIEDIRIVRFVTNGESVDPQGVIYGDRAEVPVTDVPQGPERSGYTFRYWSLNPDADPADTSQQYDFNRPVVEDLTLYAIWQPETVQYRVVYWLEKANIPIDDIDEMVAGDQEHLASGQILVGKSGQKKVVTSDYFQFAHITTRTAVAGSTVYLDEIGARVTGPAAEKTRWESALLLSDDSFGNTAGMPYSSWYASSEAVIAGDGSTVINVYYTRNLYTLQHVLTKPASGKVYVYDPAGETGLIPDGDGYVDWSSRAGSVYASYQAKVGLDLDDIFITPFLRDGTQLFHDGSGVGNGAGYILRGWGPLQKGTGGVFQGAFLKAGSNNMATQFSGTTATYNSYWENAVKKRQHKTIMYYYYEALVMYYYYEALDQSVAAPDRPPADLDYDTGANQAEYLRVENLKYMAGNIVQTVEPVFKLEQVTVPYWASDKDRQITNGVEGFTFYSLATTGLQANVYQWNGSQFYQLAGSNNTNNPDRYLFFKRNSATLTYELNGMTLPYSFTLKYQESLAGKDIFEDPAILEQYVGDDEIFAGWYADSDYITEINFDEQTMPSTNLTIFAKVVKKPISVTFLDKGEGNQVEQVQIPAGSNCEDVLIPDLSGSTYADYGIFVGWYWMVGEYAVPFDSGNILQTDTNVFAAWRAEAFELSYDLNGGDLAGDTTVPVDDHRYDYGERSRVVRESGWTKGNQLFAGWSYTDRFGDEHIYYPGSLIKVDGDMKLVARYVSPGEAISLTYDANLGSGGGTVTRIYKVNDLVDVADPAELLFTNPEFHFLGWAETPDGEAGRRPLDQFNITADTTLYAVWEDARYYVVYHENADSSDRLATDSNAPFASDGSGTTNLPSISDLGWSREGYIFIGWYESPEATASDATVSDATTSNALLSAMLATGSNAGMRAATNSDAAFGDYVPDEDEWTAFSSGRLTRTANTDDDIRYAGDLYEVTKTTHFYARWKAVDPQKPEDPQKPDPVKTWTLTYHKNDQTSVNVVFTYKDGTMATVKNAGSSEIGFSRPGYRFLGWSTTPNAVSADAGLAAGRTIAMSGNRDLFAVWEELKTNPAEQVTLTYYQNTGSGDTRRDTYTYDKDSPVSLKTAGALGFSRSGYTFLGWSRNRYAGAADAGMGAGAGYMISEDTTLYAVWKKNSGGGGGGGGSETTVSPTTSGETTAPETTKAVPSQSQTPTIPAETKPDGGIVLEIPPGHVIIKDKDGNIVFEGYIPDGNIPMAFGPGTYEVIVIGEDGVPLSYMFALTGKYGSLAKTGDNRYSVLPVILIQMAALGGIAGVVYLKRRREE